MPQLMDLYGSMLNDQLVNEQIQSNRVTRQRQEQIIQQERQEYEQKQQKQKLIQNLMSETPSLEEQTLADSESRIKHNQSMVDKLQAASKKVMAVDPEVGIKWGETANKIQQDVFKAQKEQADTKMAVLKHIAGWTGTVKDQQTLDIARQQVELRHPGLWADMKLPNNYSTLTAPIFSQVAASASTAAQQKDLEVKTIELKHANEVQELKKQEIQSKIILNRERAIAAREGLDKKKTTPNTQIKKLEADEYKLTQEYTKAIAKAEAEALKKYPAWMEEPNKYWWTDESKSPKYRREQDIKAKTEAINRQFQANFEALNRRRAELDLSPIQPPMNVATPPSTQQQYEEGKVYKDAKGNKARYVNGKWEAM